MSLANFLIAIGVLAIGVGLGAIVGYLVGRSVDPELPEEQQLEEADEFATQLSAPAWTPQARPPRSVVPLRYDHTAVTEPLPPGVFGQPLGSRRPLLAEAFVDRLPITGRHARADNAPPLPVLVLAMRKYGPGITAEFTRIVEAQEVERV